MNIALWKYRYIGRLIARGLTKEEAKANYESGKDDMNYDDSPEAAADDEMDYYILDSK